MKKTVITFRYSNCGSPNVSQDLFPLSVVDGSVSKEFYKVSMVTPIMNRLKHLMETLPKNLEDNKDYPNKEYIIYDYNSKDSNRMMKFLLDNFQSEMANGIIKYYRNCRVKHWDYCHAYNCAHRKATGDILCNIDADNFTGPGWAVELNRIFHENNMKAVCRLERNKHISLWGRIAVSRETFYKINGFNEEMKGYGTKDINFVDRARLSGCREIVMGDLYRGYIDHSNDERYANYPLEMKDKRRRYARFVNRQIHKANIKGGNFLANQGKEWGVE